MKRMLNIGQTGSIVERGISMLERHFNKDQVAEFLREVRKLGDVKEVIEVAEEVVQSPALPSDTEGSAQENVADTIMEAWAKSP